MFGLCLGHCFTSGMAIHVALQVTSYTSLTIKSFSRHDAIRQFLDGETLTAETVATQVKASINGAVSTGKSVLDVGGGTGNLWGTLFKVVEQTPYDHPWQDKLVAVVAAINDLPPRPDLNAEAWAWREHTPVWQGLPAFGRSVYEVNNWEGLLQIKEGLVQFQRLLGAHCSRTAT